MTYRNLAVALAAVCSAARIGAAQKVPVTTFDKPVAEFPESFTHLDGARELPDGRLLTIESCERVVKLIDFANGNEQQVGRTGSGPGEYRTPARLFPLPGDSSAIYDPGNRRFLVISPDGKPAGFFNPLPTITTKTPNGMVMASGFSAVTSDARGRFYAREGGIVAGPNGLERADSVAILRWDHYTGTRDTVAYYHLLGKPGPITPGERDLPFTTGIQWAAAADGRVALVHPDDYHVDFVSSSGARVSGKPIPFERVRVSDGHKQQWRDDQKPPCGSGPLTFTDASGKTLTAVPARAPEPTNWPDVLPPFLTSAAMFASDGMLWVKRTVPANDAAQYDIINGRGQLVHRVILAKRSQVLGFGKGVVYVLRFDDDDLEYAQKYRLPNVAQR